ncbi:MAG: GldG family protein [Desulfomonile tiedjei]|nr:GldG family protein [Desulfomonile tiedjei]
MKANGLQRQLLLGGGTAAGILIFLAIIVAIQYIILQHPKRWDLTGTGKYTLAEQSKKVLGTFKDKKIPVEVLAFYETKDQAQRENVRDLLNQYRDVYADFTYSFVDPDRDRVTAVQNKVEAYPTVVLKAGKKDERISAADEETLTNALLKLLRTENKKAYLLKGHGELSPGTTEAEGFSVAKEQIEKQNYTVADLVLMQTPSVPKDASILIIAGPKTDPVDPELDSIREYLNRGGSLLVFLKPFKTPKLAAMLKDYGFETRDDIIVDRMSRVFGGDLLMPVVTTYIKFPITKNFDLASFFPEARSVKVAEKPAPDVAPKELCLTSPVSWTISEEQLQSGKADIDENFGMKGPIPVMAVSTVTYPDSTEQAASAEKGTSQEPKAEAEPPKPKKARIAVFGSSLIASNKFFKLQGNGDLIMNSIAWLAEDENLIAIRPKSGKSQPIVLTASESLAFLAIPVFLMPLAWIILGAAVYFYRRRSVIA